MAAETATCVGTLDADVNVGQTRVYRVKYHVETTSVNDQAKTAIEAYGIPAIGQRYSVGNDYDNGAFVERYNATLVRESDHRKLWAVIVTFSSLPRERDDTQNDLTSWDYPWLAPAQVNGSGVKAEKALRWHYSDPGSGDLEPLRSSAGEHYDDVFGEYSTLGLTIQRAYSVNDWSLEDCREYVDTLNSATFWGAAQDFYKMASPSYSLLYTGQGIPYWDVRYEFEGTLTKWNADKHVDEGHYYISRSTNKLTRFTDDWNLSFAGKGKLDGTGHSMGYVESQTNTEYYPPNGINRYRRKNFADLGIPTSVEELLNG